MIIFPLSYVLHICLSVYFVQDQETGGCPTNYQFTAAQTVCWRKFDQLRKPQAAVNRCTNDEDAGSFITYEERAARAATGAFFPL